MDAREWLAVTGIVIGLGGPATQVAINLALSRRDHAELERLRGEVDELRGHLNDLRVEVARTSGRQR